MYQELVKHSLNYSISRERKKRETHIQTMWIYSILSSPAIGYYSTHLASYCGVYQMYRVSMKAIIKTICEEMGDNPRRYTNPPLKFFSIELN
jgi:hypothetical protein